MRITFVLPGLGASGGYRTLAEWASRLAARNHDVTMVPLSSGPAVEWLHPAVRVLLPKPAIAGKAPFRLRRVTALEPAAMRLAGRLASATVPSHQDLVIWSFIPWLPGARIRGTAPVVGYAQHDESVWLSSSAPVPYDHPCLAGLIVNSTWLQTRLPGPVRATAHLVHPGVDHTTFRAGTADTDRLAGRPRIVALGRDDVPWKGGRELRQALTELAAGRQLELIRFGTAGRGETSVPWGRQVDVGRLTSSELADLYRTADVVATASWYESFPLPPLEAMASGATVVTTRPGTEDYAVHGENALVVPARDPTALARALERALDDQELAGRLREQAASTAQRFTWDRGWKQFLAAIHATTGIAL